MTRLIALTGRAGSGKDAVGKMLGGKCFSFAEPMKRFAQEVFGFSDAQLWGQSTERNRPDERYPRACSRCDGQGSVWNGTCPECDGSGTGFLTPRFALQTLGTEWGRTCYENVWADLGVRRAVDYLRFEKHGEALRATGWPYEPGPAVITDCRFTNEAKIVRKAGGEVWRIVRPGAGLAGAAGLHPSEAEQESPEFLALVTRTIDNSGTLDDLRALVTSSG